MAGVSSLTYAARADRTNPARAADSRGRAARLPPALLGLAEWLAAEARAGRGCPSNAAIAERLETDEWQAGKLLRRVERAGLLVLRYPRPNIRVVAAPDGSWETAALATFSVAAQVERAGLRSRGCLGCQVRFPPRHRHQFCCDDYPACLTRDTP